MFLQGSTADLKMATHIRTMVGYNTVHKLNSNVNYSFSLIASTIISLFSEFAYYFSVSKMALLTAIRSGPIKPGSLPCCKVPLTKSYQLALSRKNGPLDTLETELGFYSSIFLNLNYPIKDFYMVITPDETMLKAILDMCCTFFGEAFLKPTFDTAINTAVSPVL